MENNTRRKIQAMEWGLVLDKDDARVLDHAFANMPGLGNKIFDRIGLEGMHDIHLGPYPELVGEPSTSPTNVHVSDIPLVGRVLFYYTHDTDNPNHFPFSKLEAAFEQHPWHDVSRGDIPEPFSPFVGRQKKEGKAVFGAAYGGWPVPGAKSGALASLPVVCHHP